MTVARLLSLSIGQAGRPLHQAFSLRQGLGSVDTPAGRLARGIRGRHLVFLDLISIIVGAYAALGLRYDRLITPNQVIAFAPVFLSLLLVRPLVNVRLGLYSRYWRFASVPELGRIVAACACGTVGAAAVFYLASSGAQLEGTAGFPRSFWIAELALSTALIGGSRFAIRAVADFTLEPAGRLASTRRPTLLYGAGQSGVLVARSAQRGLTTGMQPVGFLDDDLALSGRVVAGLPVFGGLATLHRAVEATHATMLLITMPSAPGAAIRRVVNAALHLGLEVRTVPSINELVDGSLVAERIRRVRVEDLLQRPIVSEHAAMVGEIIAGRTVMITGAGGSIGSELARQAFAIGPKRLILLDRSESALFTIHRELTARQARGEHGSAEVIVHLANVASRASMFRIVGREAPDVIFHAAAYKHVPMMESHPSDAAYVNVGGTMALLDAAMATSVARFVFVSTDKAVRPSSVMGASKRIGEMLVADAARKTGRPYVSVRFGNVLGSSGSVVPIFQDQLERGEPLTITHPQMTRFFMTIPEAAWLILDAAALGERDDLFVLDMGEPVRVMDLARDLVRLAGKDPDSQPFEIVGIRPGEKLHEQLFYADETVQATASAKVLRVATIAPPADVRDRAAHILALATGDHEADVARALLNGAQTIMEPPPAAPAVPALARKRRIPVGIAATL